MAIDGLIMNPETLYSTILAVVALKSQCFDR